MYIYIYIIIYIHVYIYILKFAPSNIFPPHSLHSPILQHARVSTFKTPRCCSARFCCQLLVNCTWSPSARPQRNPRRLGHHFSRGRGSGWFLGEGGLIWDLYCSVETMGTKHISWMVLILKMERDGFLVECWVFLLSKLLNRHPCWI